ncbi:L,D-transpeptidase family protein [Sandarakinorhabdus oryzae]|uniref:L,D-transpeptidase family protein n=1 Tax=Sandarakinorhabdus oryzae TaxID=2675220 RepID=UPI0012E2CFD2|nr:L,D-transpeptidase family protein [Sandarakinorhabdus oryzae]
MLALALAFGLHATALAQAPPAPATTPAQRLAAVDTTKLDTRDRASVAASLAAWAALEPLPAGRWLLVNIPAFEISLYDGAVRTGTWRAIVGKPKTPTPRFTGTVTGVILNPWWEVPASIVAESVGHLLARHPKQAAAQGYVREGDRYRQRPGPENQLGLLKLDFRNPYSVGIHDTPSRQLFAREKRAFSHGCIRVDDPFGLAAALFGPPASRDSLMALGSANPDTQRLALAAPVPVIVGYFTAEVADDGTLRLFDDVYRRLPRGEASSGDDCASP